MNFVIQSRSINRISAMSFFLVLSEYLGCKIISYGRKKNASKKFQIVLFRNELIIWIISYSYVLIFSPKVIFISQSYLCVLQRKKSMCKGENRNHMNRLHTFPNRATTGRRLSFTQCAAVNTNMSDMSDPPHEKLTLY